MQSVIAWLQPNIVFFFCYTKTLVLCNKKVSIKIYILLNRGCWTSSSSDSPHSACLILQLNHGGGRELAVYYQAIYG